MEKNITTWVSWAFRYHVSVTGPIVISVLTEKTTIKNDILSLFNLTYHRSSRLDFDGGIQLELHTINTIGNDAEELIAEFPISVKRFNLESTDGEYDLDEFLIAKPSDCELLHCKISFEELTPLLADRLNKRVKHYLDSNEFGILRTFVGLKLSAS